MSYKGLRMFSNMPEENRLRLSLESVELAEPTGYEVLVEVKAAPINPSDLYKMFYNADVAALEQVEVDGVIGLEAPVKTPANTELLNRVNAPVTVGNEGSGVVVAAGEKPEAQALIGKTVAFYSGSMYSQYCIHDARQCLVHGDDVSFIEASSSYVNPMTAQVMLETMRSEGHSALVQTAAASSLGQMLNRLCMAEGVEIINIVRHDDQLQLLKSQGANRVINSSVQKFHQELIDAISETRATILFDATFGGHMTSDVLTCMEQALQIGMTEYIDYTGSGVFKQAYVYGGLDPSPMKIELSVGFNWSVASFILPVFAARVPAEKLVEFGKRITKEIKTTFKTEYGEQIGLKEALIPEMAQRYYAKSTGGKFLVLPND